MNKKQKKEMFGPFYCRITFMIPTGWIFSTVVYIQFFFNFSFMFKLTSTMNKKQKKEIFGPFYCRTIFMIPTS